MLKVIRTSGRTIRASLIGIGLLGALIGVGMASLGWSPPELSVDDRNVVDPTFTIGPIEGLTTTWHWAPPTTSIPLGTIAGFFQPAAPNATVIWTAAAEVARDDQGSTAVCPLVQIGITIVQVQVIPADGGEAISSQSRFNVVDIGVEQITVSAIDVWVDPVEIDEDLGQDELNEQTMGYFFGLDSIAAMRDLGDGYYRTSVNRRVHTSVEVNPPGFAPLIEWRYDGQAVEAPPAVFGMVMNWSSEGMGATAAKSFPLVGNHVIEVGSGFNSQEIEVETYRVTITSHSSGLDTVPEGEPITFTAVTNPPGYEDQITWLSSTKYGSAEPVLGQGPEFTVEFNDTWGIDPEIGDWQWFGVRADDAVFSQDQKCGPDCAEEGKSNVECLKEFLPPAYANRTPVARLLDENGNPMCTGWIIASPNCLITNEHCDVVPGWTAQFNYECDQCVGGMCKETTEYNVVGVIRENAVLDYALVELQGNPAAVWGVLPVSCDLPTVDEKMYMIHHGAGMKKGYFPSSYTGFDGAGDVQYPAPNSGGTSGSPVFSRFTHFVEALHHAGTPGACGEEGCGVPMNYILPDALPHILAAECTPNVAVPCVGMTGACCVGDRCITATEVVCDILGGTFRPGAACDPNPCD